MNKLVNKFWLAGDKFVSTLHLTQVGFTYSACGPFTKHCERIQKFREIGDLNHICKNQLDKACFVHDTAYSDTKDLAKRTISGRTWKDRAYAIAINFKYNGYQIGLASVVCKFF